MNKEVFMREVYLYDSLKAGKRKFEPIVKDEVSIYYCGPTVYNFVHIGNIRPVLTFDLLTRVLSEIGYKVHCISNYTDIDDKIISKALESNKSEKEVSEFYIKAYEDCLTKLNCLPLEDHPRVSNYIPQIVEFISTIMSNGFAYKGEDGDIYFDVTKDPNYGEISKIDIQDLISGARIETKADKRSPSDFALWKNTADEGVKFETVLGKGRPGWHTECVVMINSHFKKSTIDIHGGGFDLKFPHHENENAQQYAYKHAELANYWMHVGFINMGDEKMSKSLGNIVLAKDAIDKYGANAIRYFFYTTSYRSPLSYTPELLEKASSEVDRYVLALKKLEAKAGFLNVKFNAELDELAYERFMNYLADDLSSANAISEIEAQVKKANILLRTSNLDFEQASKVYNTLNKFFDIFGFKYEKVVLSDEDKEHYALYQKYRMEKDYEKSDIYRKLLIERGLI